MDFSNIPTGLDIANADSLEQRTTETAKAFAKHVEQIEAGIQQKRERLEGELQDRLSRMNPDDRKLVREALSRDVDKEINATRREVVELSKEQRQAMLEQLDKLESEIQVLERLHQSPQQVLGRSNSGDTRKTQLMTQLKMGGPAQLETFAELAIATGDRAMASALLLTVQSMKTRERPFAPAEFAERVTGEEVKHVQQRLLGLRNKITAARHLNTEFSRGRSDPTSKIERGIAARAAAA